MGRPLLRLAGVAAALATLVLLPSASGASLAITLDLAGTVNVDLRATATNGSALRSAMDGDFAPLVDQLTPNASQRTNLLDQIAIAEATPFLNTLFGNRDGTVTVGEVALFEQLIRQQVQLLPSGSFSSGGSVRLTWDGTPPSTSTFGGVTFANAPGPVSSPDPVTLLASTTEVFPSSGSTHVLAIATNGTAVPAAFGSTSTSVDVTISTPAGVAITSAEGFSTVRVMNDPFGWGPASLNGTVDAAGTSTGGSVSFGPAFPTGDLLLGAVAVVAVVVPLGLVVRRRRRRRRASP